MEPQATYNQPPPASRSTEKHRDYMVLLWLRLKQKFGEEWEAKNGPVDGRKFEDWVKVLRTQPTDAIAKALGKCQHLTEPPSLVDFVKLCGDQPTPPARSTTPKDHTIRDREMARQQQLATSSKSRRSSEVESFMDAYHNCGCGKRWPGGEVVL